MGAERFFEIVEERNASLAFTKAVKQAQYDNGHSGYTGSIAEKNDFIMIDLPEGKKVGEFAEELVDNCDERIEDKWGPAGCIRIKDGKYLFFGYASS
jgi:hypothetical protein